MAHGLTTLCTLKEEVPVPALSCSTRKDDDGCSGVVHQHSSAGPFPHAKDTDVVVEED